MKELSLEETKVVSGGHRTFLDLHSLHGNPHASTGGVPGVAAVLTAEHGKAAVPAYEGGWGAGGINANS